MSRHARIRWKWILIACLVAAAAVAAGSAESWDWRAFLENIEEMNKATLFILAAMLPLFGFSIGLTYAVVGAVFGSWAGMAVVVAITMVHLCGSHWIARSFLRAPLERFLERRRKKIPELPEGEAWSVALMTALVPGLPYFVRNYLLALSPVPFATWFWICLPVYVFRSGLVILLGDFSSEMNWRRLGILGAVFLLKVAVCALLFQRVRKRFTARSKTRNAHSRR